MATSLTQFGITWTFDADYTTGQYANGDYYVVAPSGLTITGISPASTIEAVRNKHPSGTVTNSTINGSMVNPVAGVSAVTGFDSGTADYSASYNAARPGGSDLSSGNPLVLAAGSSLVSSKSNSLAWYRPALTDAAILTVVASAPSAGSFRPPYCGTDKTHYWNKSGLDYSILGTRPPPPGTPALADVEAYFARSWIEIGTEQNGRYSHPSNNQPEYGSNMASQLGSGLLMLALDYSDAQKETLYIRLVQYGIDVYGAAVSGGNWSANGGLNMGRKMPMLLAGLALNDSNILAYADKSLHNLFQEDQQTFVVDAAQLLVTPYTADGRPRYVYKENAVTFSGSDVNWTAHGLIAGQPMRFATTGTLPTGIAVNTDYIISATGLATDSFRVASTPSGTPITFTGGSGTHTATMIGVPEWGEKHAFDKSRDGSNWGTYYRDVNFRVTIAHCLMAHMLSAESYWNNDVFFDYHDRMKIMVDPTEFGTFFNNMWVAYRSGAGGGFPSAPTGLSATAFGNRYISLAWTDNASNEDYFLVERKTTGAFSTLGYAAASATAYIDNSIAAGTQYTYRVTAVNGTGSSAATNESSATASQAARSLSNFRLWGVQ